MPIIILPPLLDVPAIIRSAAHSSARPVPARRPEPPRPVEQPAGSAQAPEIVGTVPPPLPPPATTTPGAATSQSAPSQTNAERRGR